MKIITKPKLWGNSLGFIIPKEVVKKQGITLDTNITIEVKRENPVKDLFGCLNDWKIDPQKVKEKFRKEEREVEERKWEE